MADIIKGFIGKEDFILQTNTNPPEKFERGTSVGGTTELYKMPDIWDGTGRVNVAAWIDATAYATLELANTAAYNAGKTLLIYSNWTLTANTTLIASMIVLKGGSFTKASTYTLTINGPFGAGPYQVFSGFDAGDVTFGAGAVKEVYPEWWGENTIPGTTDIAASIQAAFEAGNIVLLPDGICAIGTTLSISQRVGFTLIGHRGMVNAGGSGITGGTILRWIGNPNGTMISILNSRQTELNSFVVDGASISGVTGISISWDGSTPPSTSGNYYYDLNIQNCALGGDIGNVSNYQTDLNKFIHFNVIVPNGGTGIRIRGGNTLFTQFLQSTFDGDSGAIYLIDIQKGDFYCSQCIFGPSDIGINVNLNIESINLTDCYVEGPTQFLVTATGTITIPRVPILLQNLRGLMVSASNFISINANFYTNIFGGRISGSGTPIYYYPIDADITNGNNFLNIVGTQFPDGQPNIKTGSRYHRIGTYPDNDTLFQNQDIVLSNSRLSATNLRGIATFTGASTVIVTFSPIKASQNYRVTLGGQANETFWVSNKLQGSFVINSSNPSSTANVEWIVIDDP